ncbi:MAG TPA: sugar phosphate isomerase/epimerase [Pseudomonadales bacterium]|nr:sugar phosphate isomerase/epimerase [Pseudomonadales bacterium]
MELKIFKTLWGHSGSLDDAVSDCRENGFDGIEGQVPPEMRREFHSKLPDSGLDFIAEICTAGSYVPNRKATVEAHLESLHRQAEFTLESNPLFLTVIGGCDAWPMSMSVLFFEKAMELADKLGITMSFETHRSRSLFNPWITRDILHELPQMKLTCDFSHWCVVCERLIDTEPEIIALCARHAHHVHARVGYDQGPQVPHPAAPAFFPALEAHERWWSLIWQEQSARGFETTTMTPEFGPDGYLQCEPFTGKPVADLKEINNWMAKREREHFRNWTKEMSLNSLTTHH